MNTEPDSINEEKTWRDRTHEVIFEADTLSGKTFDLVLIWSILISVGTVMLDSVESIRATWGGWLYAVEWFFTILFTVEYVLRLISVRSPWRYARSFFGIIDLVSILPTYVSIFVPGAQYLLVIRILRVLRIFRVLKLAYHLREARQIVLALKASRAKITVFVFAVLTMVVILGSLMYLIEGEEGGFTSIPRSVYWAIVTLTTVGYGDISPQSGLGQALAAMIMILGYSLIAVPTGLVTAQMTKHAIREVSTQACPNCSAEGHDIDAKHCKFCGTAL